MDHPELTPRDMIFRICGLLMQRLDRKVSPEEIGLRITMERRYPLFQAFAGSEEGEPAGTPTQALDNLLQELEDGHPET